MLDILILSFPPHHSDWIIDELVTQANLGYCLGLRSKLVQPCETPDFCLLVDDREFASFSGQCADVMPRMAIAILL